MSDDTQARRIKQLEHYNAGLAAESYERFEQLEAANKRIAELEEVINSVDWSTQ